jgi:hypothetical protein
VALEAVWPKVESETPPRRAAKHQEISARSAAVAGDDHVGESLRLTKRSLVCKDEINGKNDERKQIVMSENEISGFEQRVIEFSRRIRKRVYAESSCSRLNKRIARNDEYVFRPCDVLG